MRTLDLSARLAAIADKLARAGADGAALRLDPPMTEPEVAAFEAARGITLPADYRAFVTTLGRGGPGPYHGLRPPSGWRDFADMWLDAAPDDWLARPCPLAPGPNPLPEWPEDDDISPEAAAMYQGIMALGTRGCSYAMGLVITGAARGRVVYLDAAHDEPPYVVRDADFVAWYDRWLDARRVGRADGWFGYGPAGDEATLLAIVGATDDPVLRTEAVANLHRLPDPSPAVWPALAARLDGEGPERAVAAALFVRAEPRWAPRLAPLLDDPDPAVRRAAIDAVIALDADRHDAAVWRRLLDADDRGERETAFHALKRAGRLDHRRLEQLAADDARPAIAGFARAELARGKREAGAGRS